MRSASASVPPPGIPGSSSATIATIARACITSVKSRARPSRTPRVYTPSPGSRRSGRFRRLMKIGEKQAVTIEYTLKDDKGEVLDTSDGREPLTYLQGAGNLIPGLENALEGKGAGDAVEVTLTPENGYGRRDETLIRNIPLRKLNDPSPKVG